MSDAPRTKSAQDWVVSCGLGRISFLWGKLVNAGNTAEPRGGLVVFSRASVRCLGGQSRQVSVDCIRIVRALVGRLWRKYQPVFGRLGVDAC